MKISYTFHPFIFACLLFFSFSCKEKNATLFNDISDSKTNITFSNEVKNKNLFNILYYLYFYNGGGVATGDINNDGLIDVYFTANAKGKNKLYLNKGNFIFEDITAKAAVAGISDWCTGVTMADVNNDGFLDIYVSTVNRHHGLKGKNELYINNKNNSFTERGKEYGLDFSGFSTQAAFFDYDHDGDLDCYLLNQSQKPNSNIGDTSKRNNYDSLAGDCLYRNELINTTGKSTTTFFDVSKQAGIYQSSLGYGLGIAVADLNNDGWEDIYVGNDFHENDYYYINTGKGNFIESGAKHFKHYSRFSMGNDIADYNNDGNLDLVTVDMIPPDEKTLKTYGSDENLDIYKLKLMSNGYQYQYSRNCLQTNNSNGISFSETGLIAGIAATDWSWSPLFADFDNDGKKDLFISSGIAKRPVDLDYVKFVSDLVKKMNIDKTDSFDNMAIENMPDGSSHPFLFKGDGEYKFNDVSNEWGTGKFNGYFNGASYADLDNDGDLDLVMNCFNAKAKILENNTAQKKSISISFEGSESNKFGIGCKTYLYQKGKMQYQQLMLTRGFQSSVAPRLSFGLDTTSLIDSLIIIWPSQKKQTLVHIMASNALLHIQEKDAALNGTTSALKNETTFENITDKINLQWSHKENDFLDFNLQYLIPHVESTRGPKMAVADVNGDGLDDFFVCGAKQQPGALFIQNSNGGFINTDTALFALNAISEDVDAVFFDANNDGYKDLWVVSGGNQVPENSLSNEDRLYINDGKGHFKKSYNFISQQYENKSCISVADIDHDGDIDVFVGNLGNATSYGATKPSYLFRNDGKGVFTLDYKSLKLDELGLVTSSVFTDINGDGWQDLIVTGEWMPLKVYVNRKGVFEPFEVAGSTGLWQTIYATDVNGDGYKDLLAGNWGHNTKLWAGKNGPLKLYIKDFDGNGSVEQILCYTIEEKEYTFLAKDELERALPLLKKAYLTYGEVAGKTVDYMFYDLFKDYKELKAETLTSSYFMNDGKGNFKRMDLPYQLQLAPIMAFVANNDSSNSYMGVGNFYGVLPYEGRYDALQPTAFSFDKKINGFNNIANIPAFDGEGRDIKWLNTTGGNKIMVIACNNKALQFFKKN